MTEIIKDVGLGILCWKEYESLRYQLESYKKNKFLELFEEKIIFFQEIDQQAKKLAHEYGMKACGQKDNKGIYGGFRKLAENMNSQYILLLESDQPIMETQNIARTQIENGKKLLEENKTDAIAYSHLKQPGMKTVGDKFTMFFPTPKQSKINNIIVAIRKIIMPLRAQKQIGFAPYHMAHPEKTFKQFTKDKDTGFLIISSKYRRWSNQPFMVKKTFFINKLLNAVEMSKRKKYRNGFKTIEGELNRNAIIYTKGYWIKHNFKIAISPGLFTHKRIGEREK